MIIGVDREGYIISIGTLNDEKAYSIKIIDKADINIATNNYKYVNGRIVDLGLKPELKMSREDKIKQELIELDTTINRATEDLYTLTNTTPYQKTAEVIARKEELRQELKELEV